MNEYSLAKVQLINTNKMAMFKENILYLQRLTINFIVL